MAPVTRQSARVASHVRAGSAARLYMGSESSWRSFHWRLPRYGRVHGRVGSCQACLIQLTGRCSGSDSHSAIESFLRHIGFRLHKSLTGPERLRADIGDVVAKGAIAGGHDDDILVRRPVRALSSARVRSVPPVDDTYTIPRMSCDERRWWWRTYTAPQ